MRRPSTDDFVLPYNPVRWVCQYRRGDCDGFFTVSGYGDMARQPCPLFERCGGRNPQLEHLHRERHKGMKVLRAPADPMRTRRHTIEGSALERCFFRERDKKTYACRRESITERRRAAYHAQDLVAVNEARREKYAQQQAALGRTVRRWSELTPPCGGDCENCPYPDGVCRHEDFDPKKERRRLKDQRYRKRQKERKDT